MNISRARDFVSSTAPDFLGANEIMIDELFQRHTTKNKATQKKIEDMANAYKVGKDLTIPHLDFAQSSSTSCLHCTVNVKQHIYKSRNKIILSKPKWEITKFIREKNIDKIGFIW